MISYVWYSLIPIYPMLDSYKIYTFIAETQRRMQFWFNLTSINTTEDVIESYFHIYKKKASLVSSLKTHTVTVRGRTTPNNLLIGTLQ